MIECMVKECTNKVVAQSLCAKHYKRLQRHGDLKQTRPLDWGKRSPHPLNGQWDNIRKLRASHDVDKRWDNFWDFVKSIGKKPSKNHRLIRTDVLLPYGPDNFHWKKCEENISAAEKAKIWRDNNPGRVKHNYLKKKYGISLDKYNNMYLEQEGKCKICGDLDNSKYDTLAVDHCHKTMKVRGLLCHKCNTALGSFKDSIEILQNAINYLKK